MNFQTFLCADILIFIFVIGQEFLPSMFSLVKMIIKGANEGGHGCAVTHSLNSFSSHVLLNVKFTSPAGSPDASGGLCMSYYG